MIYQINQHINKPIVFYGLKSQYIWYLGIGIALLLLVFALLYITGVSLLICLPVILLAGGMLFSVVYRFSKDYGEHGWMKEVARRATPGRIKCDKLFTK